MIRKIKFLAARALMGLTLAIGLGFGLLAAGVAAVLGCLLVFVIWLGASLGRETVDDVAATADVHTDADQPQPQAG